MKIKLALLAVFVTVFSLSTTSADVRSDAKQQVEFGIKVAQKGLWNEAIYRWERAIELDPDYASAHNNLAIAYEQKGEFEKARKAYGRATELDPGNLIIQENFDLFSEIDDRRNYESDR